MAGPPLNHNILMRVEMSFKRSLCTDSVVPVEDHCDCWQRLSVSARRPGAVPGADYCCEPPQLGEGYEGGPELCQPFNLQDRDQYRDLTRIYNLSHPGGTAEM